MTDNRQAAALRAWEQSFKAYRDAADALFRRGAPAGAPDPDELALLEALEVEQRDAFRGYLAAARGD